MIFVLIGMPGSGKSCMGRAIARKLSMKSVDSDRLIERRTGKPLHAIIKEDGLEAFKNIEKETLLSIYGDNLVLSTGGSAVYYPEAMEYLKSIGKVIYLFCSYDVIVERLGDFSKRGVVLEEGQTLRDLYDERSLLYKKYADITVDCSGNAFPKYQARVLAALRGFLGE